MPPKVLDDVSLEGIARYIESEKCKRVFIMAGAGISTAAGIPDFRSPGTGLYANLARLNLPYPEAVFDIKFFRRDPLPFYTLAYELAPGRYRPTRTHSFFRLLHEKRLLHTCFTQNIDTLERRAGLPGNKIIEAHGSFATQRCIDCKTPYDDGKMKENIRNKIVPKCERCNGLVKPDIVFFGEALPLAFHEAIDNLIDADLLIIVGTSLTVYPFASLAQIVPYSCPRVLINIDAVGDIGNRSDDVVLLDKCDDVIQRLCKLLKWEEDLEKLWEETVDSQDPEALAAGKPLGDAEEEAKKLADQLERSLRLGGNVGDEQESKGTTNADKTNTSAPKAAQPSTAKPQVIDKGSQATEKEPLGEGGRDDAAEIKQSEKKTGEPEKTANDDATADEQTKIQDSPGKDQESTNKL